MGKHNLKAHEIGRAIMDRQRGQHELDTQQIPARRASEDALLRIEHPANLDTEKLYGVLFDIAFERGRQQIAHDAGKIPWDCKDPEVSMDAKIAVLGEEFGEVCKAQLEEEPTEALYKELVQVAAVATAMAESLL